MLNLPAYYHPTTILWVDDDKLFLRAASELFRPIFTIQSFNNPHECVTQFKNYRPQQFSLLQSDTNNECYETKNHAPVDFDVTSLYDYLKHNPARVNEISIMVADYHMPNMTGLELCEQLKEFPFKKILLTGEASQVDAIAAFNANIIDRFVRKDSPSLASELQQYVSTLSRQYFRERSRSLITHLEVDSPLPLTDPVFIDFFEKKCMELDVKEYCLIDKNGSFLLVNGNNEKFNLVIHTERTLNSFIKLHDDIETVTSLLQKVSDRILIPFFGIGKEGWEFEDQEWEKHFFEPEVLVGRERYFLGVVKG